MIGTQGLVHVRTEHLKHLLKNVHSGDLPCPIDRKGLATVGLLHLGDDLGILHGLDQSGARAVLVSVLSERLHKGPRRFV